MSTQSDSAPEVAGRVKNSSYGARSRWFTDHVAKPANEIAEFLAGTNVSLTGARVLDVGCGDGFIDLGIIQKFQPSLLVGTDLFAVDLEDLKKLSLDHLKKPLPECLRFSECTETALPFPDASFDIVISWSVFEHVSDPVAVLKEIRRVLRPGGYMFLQIWPLFHSQRGSHLWNWYPEGWEHLQKSPDSLRTEISEKLSQSPELLESMLVDLDTLNRLTMDQLQDSISASGMTIRRVGLQADTINVSQSLLRYRLTDLAISGVKILASR
jgi:ubiquinone/menaquinone biosynthesis C-methylase UbiE